ncbi:MAG: hypothetical protein AAFX08_02680 [Pseudomonadota bacterium]
MAELIGERASIFAKRVAACLAVAVVIAGGKVDGAVAQPTNNSQQQQPNIQGQPNNQQGQTQQQGEQRARRPSAFERFARQAAAPPRVALINATIYYNNGRALSATVREARLVNSYAPKSFAQDAGDWMVMIYGFEVGEDAGQQQGPDDVQRARPSEARLLKRYRILDPGVGVERETPPGSEQAFERVLLNGPYEWRLVAPLYEGARKFDPRTIEVIDTRTGRVVLSRQFG